MTIRMLQAWSGYPQQSIITLAAEEEARLVGLGLATTDLDGEAEGLEPVMAKKTLTGGIDISVAGKSVDLSGVDVRRSVAVVTNLYPTNSERLNTLNANTTPAVNHGNAVEANPVGIRTGSVIGTSGSVQSNYTVAADDAYYLHSFYAHVPAGVTGAKVSYTVAFDGGDGATINYDWDNPLTASTNAYVPEGSGPVRSLIVDYVTPGIRRLSIPIKNSGKTVLYESFNGSAATNKAVLSGFQLTKVKSGETLRPMKYVPVGQAGKPWSGFGKNGGSVSYERAFPFRDVVVFSDSIWGSGAGLAADGKWRLFDSVLEFFGVGSLYSYSGYTTAQVCAEFDAQNVSGAFDSSMVIFNVGRNDATALLSGPGREQVLARLVSAVAALGHDNYKVCGVLAKFPCSASPGSEENQTTNTAQYDALLAYNAMLLAKFGSKFIDLQAISVASYNPMDGADVAAFAIGSRPPSLAPTSGDGLHPGPLENMVVGAGVIASIKSDYGIF